MSRLDPKTSILIADDHDIIREGIKNILRDRAEYQIIAEAADGEETVEKVEKLKPDILLLDISMPKRGGLDIIEQVHHLSPGTKIIMITVHRTPIYITKALRSGVKGYLHKENVVEDLLAALRRVTAGGTYLGSAVSEYLTKSSHEEGVEKVVEKEVLTNREKDIIRLVVDGKTAKEIAEALFVSQRTVENFKNSILKKLNFHRTADLIRYAIEHKLVD